MSNLVKRLDAHFIACAAAAGAAVVGTAQKADAGIVWSGAVKLPIALTTNGLYLNVVTGQINEPGFSFEGFDAVGRARTQDNGQNVDTTGSIIVDGDEVQFQDASDLVEALAQSDEARNCYVARWLEFANGREFATVDVALRDRLAKQGMGVKELVTTLATSPEFRSRVEAGQ